MNTKILIVLGVSMVLAFLHITLLNVFWAAWLFFAASYFLVHLWGTNRISQPTENFLAETSRGRGIVPDFVSVISTFRTTLLLFVGVIAMWILIQILNSPTLAPMWWMGAFLAAQLTGKLIWWFGQSPDLR